MPQQGSVNNFSPINSKTCLYFTVASIPTAAELAAVVRLQAIYGYVHIRSGVDTAGTGATSFGGSLEPADAIAGTAIPTAYSAGVSGYADGDVSAFANAKESSAETFIIVTATRSTTFSHTTTLQLILIKADLNRATDAVTLTDITASASWSSGTTGNMTIGASTGLVTGVAAGTSLITASYTAASGDAQTKTITLTAS